MNIEFVKMHGCGNDFLVIDNRIQNIDFTCQMITQLADYKRSIGFDQLMIIENSRQADIFLKIFNKDGSKASACGNGTRCVASLVLSLFKKDKLLIETENRFLTATKESDKISVNMGEGKIIAENLQFDEFTGSLIDVGNQHIVINISKGGSTNKSKLDTIDIVKHGSLIEKDPRFPKGVNVNFVEIITPNHVNLKTWERGAGNTLSCGSGACASFYFLNQKKLIANSCVISQAGGDLELGIIDNNIYMKGEANISYFGTTIWKS